MAKAPKVLFRTQGGTPILKPVAKPANLTLAQAGKAVRDYLRSQNG